MNALSALEALATEGRTSEWAAELPGGRFLVFTVDKRLAEPAQYQVWLVATLGPAGEISDGGDDWESANHLFNSYLIARWREVEER